jgi:hypothetical protein
MIKSLSLISIFIFITACGLATTRPKLEMSYAQAAFMAAKEAKAEEHAPADFRKAEIYYLKAKSAYRRKYFNKAKSYAILCQKFAEKAEFAATKKLLLNQ